ncbi:SRPBCC family protein [Solirubrobacter sp. CPCC 204708]|uniref:SRPBCC family protein n=1 Tax=Solirubrobacter deserti TaxID=2282478 RepID=A0ABT4RQM8_9ACTN|nr:SRPBCC family protein [Solirubrobacter deserti]MBE2318263.1 SRPBCC family protein [Solirubrobacter deserti]MDA0140601.1 SRPBCC family protein [Solirubrobacter deserti]
MKPVRAQFVVEAPGVEAEQLWHDRSRWASWIDGFTHLEKLEGEWPLEGARRVYSSRVTGRALVSERVLRYTAGDGLTLMVEDERTTATQRVRFETDGVRTRITVEVEAEPKEKMPPGQRWWWRRKRGESLQRTLQRFSYELAAER